MARLSSTFGRHGFWSLANVRRFRAAPLAFCSQLRDQHADLARFRLGPYRAALLNHPDLIREALTHGRNGLPKHQRFTRVLRQVLGESLFIVEGDDWLRKRRLVQPAFDSRSMVRYRQIIHERSEMTVQRWTTGCQDLSQAMVQLTLEILMKCLFDVDLDDAPWLREAEAVRSETLVRECGAMIRIPDAWPSAAKRRKRQAFATLDQFVWNLIRQRRQEGGERGDLLSGLSRAVDHEGDGRGLSDRQVRDEAMLMLNAGHETTSAALTWTCYLLSRHPEVQRQVAVEVQDGPCKTAARKGDDGFPLLERVIQEALRLYPPTWMLLTRWVDRDLELAGAGFRKGTWIFISPYVTHRDPRYFADPEAFRPDRFERQRAEQIVPHTYFPFGTGARSCLGQRFAMMEMTTILAALLRRFWLRPAPEQLVVTPEPLIALRPQGGLRLQLSVKPNPPHWAGRRHDGDKARPRRPDLRQS